MSNYSQQVLEPHVKTPTWSSIATIQYLGGKSRLIPRICPLIRDTFTDCRELVDLFSGTGAVAYALQPYFRKIYANDVQYYSYVMLQAILNGAKIEPTLSEKILSRAKKISEALESQLEEPLAEEDRLIFGRSPQDYREYQHFCVETPLRLSSVCAILLM